ncbi:hypothetical protein Tco_0088417 [Tanacetum coccineum]
MGGGRVGLGGDSWRDEKEGRGSGGGGGKLSKLVVEQKERAEVEGEMGGRGRVRKKVGWRVGGLEVRRRGVGKNRGQSSGGLGKEGSGGGEKDGRGEGWDGGGWDREEEKGIEDTQREEGGEIGGQYERGGEDRRMGGDTKRQTRGWRRWGKEQERLVRRGKGGKLKKKSEGGREGQKWSRWKMGKKRMGGKEEKWRCEGKRKRKVKSRGNEREETEVKYGATVKDELRQVRKRKARGPQRGRGQSVVNKEGATLKSAQEWIRCWELGWRLGKTKRGKSKSTVPNTQRKKKEKWMTPSFPLLPPPHKGKCLTSREWILGKGRDVIRNRIRWSRGGRVEGINASNEAVCGERMEWREGGGRLGEGVRGRGEEGEGEVGRKKGKERGVEAGKVVGEAEREFRYRGWETETGIGGRGGGIGKGDSGEKGRGKSWRRGSGEGRWDEGFRVGGGGRRHNWSWGNDRIMKTNEDLWGPSNGDERNKEP